MTDTHLAALAIEHGAEFTPTTEISNVSRRASAQPALSLAGVFGAADAEGG